MDMGLVVINGTMVVLAICVSILAVIGTLVVIFIVLKEMHEHVSDFLRDYRAKKRALMLDNFQYKSLDEAITVCSDKCSNNNLDYEERESYRQLKSWLIELKNRSDKV